jgi:hypothetical protein
LSKEASVSRKIAIFSLRTARKPIIEATASQPGFRHNSATGQPKHILEKLDRAWEALLEEIYNPIYGTSH